jgi:hypothetical protein
MRSASTRCSPSTGTDAVLRRPDVGALELILRGHLALDVFADLAVDLAQLLGDVAR